MAKRKTPPLQPAPRHPSAGLLRRLGALLYDYLVVIALLIIAGFIGMGVAHLLLATGMATVPEGKDAAWLLTSPSTAPGWPSSSAVSTPGSGSAPARPSACGLAPAHPEPGRQQHSRHPGPDPARHLGLWPGQPAVCVQSRRPRAFQDIWAECEVVVLGKTENLEQLNR
jgi:hypothetical protein